jgi:protein-histidine N-methyltransferase
MAFSFGFSGDDIDIDDSENNSGVPDVVGTQSTANALPELVKASQHDMNELVRFGPEKIHETLIQSQIFECRAN